MSEESVLVCEIVPYIVDVPRGESVLLYQRSVWVGERVPYIVAYQFGLSV